MTKSLKEKTFTVNFGPLDYDAKVVITSNIFASRTKRDKIIGRTNMCEYGTALCSKVERQGVSYIFLPRKFDVGTAAHESVHCIHQMYEHYGVEAHDSEMFAYHLEYLLREILKRK